MKLIHLESQTNWWRESRSVEYSNKLESRLPVKLNLTFINSIFLSQLNGFDATISLNMIWCYLYQETRWQGGTIDDTLSGVWSKTCRIQEKASATRGTAEFSSVQFLTYSFLLFIRLLRIFCGVQFSNIVFHYIRL